MIFCSLSICYPVCKLSSLPSLFLHVLWNVGGTTSFVGPYSHSQPFMLQVVNTTSNCRHINTSRWRCCVCNTALHRMAQAAPAGLIAERSEQEQTPISATLRGWGYCNWKALGWYLDNPISSFQRSIFAGWAVPQDMFDKDPSHHFPTTQTAAHPSSSNNADPQWLARLSPKFNPVVIKKGAK